MTERFSWMIRPQGILEPSLQQALNGEPIVVIKLGNNAEVGSLIVVDTKSLVQKNIGIDEILHTFEAQFEPEEITDCGYTSEETGYRLLIITPEGNQTDTDRIATAIHSIGPQE